MESTAWFKVSLKKKIPTRESLEAKWFLFPQQREFQFLFFISCSLASHAVLWSSSWACKYFGRKRAVLLEAVPVLEGKKSLKCVFQNPDSCILIDGGRMLFNITLASMCGVYISQIKLKPDPLCLPSAHFCVGKCATSAPLDYIWSGRFGKDCCGLTHSRGRSWLWFAHWGFPPSEKGGSKGFYPWTDLWRVNT